MVKTSTTLIRKYTVRLVEINRYLNNFPPHQPKQAIPMEQLLEILKFAILGVEVNLSFDV